MTTWGSWEGPSGTRFRVGIDLSISGTTITARYYLDSEGGVNDGQKLVMGYSITGSVSYTASQPYGGGTQLIATRSITSSRGVQRRFSARIEGIYNGASPRVDAYATVPAAPPSAPGTPSASTVTSNSTTITWSAPSSTNGASIERYQVQRADNSSFTSGTAAATTTSRSYTSTSLQPNRTYYWRVRAENSAGWSSWSSGRGITTSPATPAAPTGVTISRSTDTSQTLAWARTATTAAPYDSQQIERKDTSSDVWARIATVSGTATSYTDNTTVASRRYDYRVRAVNSGGASAYSPVVGISTTPAAPNSVQAVKSGTSITVSWAETTTQWGIYAHVIEDNPGGTGWVVIATVGDQTSWVHSNPNTAVTHQYRVSTRVYLTTASAGNYLTSAPSTPSNMVQLLAPPLAPSLVSPTGVQDRDEAITLAWKHNPVDTTAQEAYELKYRINTGSWVTYTGTTAQTRTIAAPGQSGTLEWQVRTKGEHATFGPWSAVWGFNLASRPNAVILAPADNAPLPASRVALEWSYNNSDAAGQTQWEAQLLRGQDLIEARTGSNNGTQLTLTIALADRTGYTVRLRVRASSGMWSVWETASFTTNFPQPVTVEPIPVWDQETGTVSLTFTDPPVPVLYAWTGPEDGSTSTSTTDAGTLTNLATNPGFEASGSSTDILLNLATNPRMVASASAVEVWRNYHPNPACVGNNGLTVWVGGGTNAVVGSDQAAAWTPLGSARRWSWTVRDSASGSVGPLPTALTFPATKSQRTVVWRFRASVGGTYRMIAEPGTDVIVNATSGHVTIGSGEVGTMWATYTPLVDGGVPTQLRTDTANIRTGTGVWVEISDVDAYEGPYRPDRVAFSGSYSPIPELSPYWTGTVNNSPATLRGYLPRGVLAAAGAQGQNYTISDGYEGETAQRYSVWTTEAVGIPAFGTGAATTGTIYTLAMWVRSNHPVTVTPRVKSAFVTGHEVTLVPKVWTLVRTVVTAGSGADAQTGLILHAGAGHSIGTNVDISRATLVAGSVPNLVPFHGGWTPYEEWEPYWKGTEDQSNCALRVNRAAYVTASGFGAHCYQSPQWSSSGTYSVCVDGSLMSGATGVAPEGIVARDPNEGLWPVINPGSTYTVAAWLRLAEPGVDVISRMRRFMLYTSTDGGSTYTPTGSDPAPNEPGIYLMRWTFTVPANANKWILRLGGNGSAAYGVEGDACRAWWDDLTIVEGEHPDLMPFHGGYQSTTAIDSITVQRRINDGEWVTLAEDVQPDGAVLDQLPTVAGVNTYRAVSKTALPTSAEGEAVDFQIREPGWVYVNHGPGFGDLFRFYGNVKLSGSTGREKVLHQFVGRQRPVAFFGESFSQSVNVAGRLTPDSSSLYDVEDAVTSAEIVCLRDPKGRRLFGVLGELSHTWEAPTLCAISFEVTEVDYDE